MLSNIVIVTEFIALADVVLLSEERFGDMVKAVVDVRRNIMALGGELHADEEQVLLDDGSKQEDLWGINIYHAKPRSEWIEFDSMINIRPRQENRTRGVENSEIQKSISEIVNHLIINEVS